MESGANKSINDLIHLIERNKQAQDRANWYNNGKKDLKVEKEVKEEAAAGEEEADFKDVRLLIFAADSPFTQSLEPLFENHDLTYAITDSPEQAVDIVMNNPQIRHVMIDLDRPTNPALGMNVFADLKTVNPHILVYHCTKNPMSMESRNIQVKGSKLMQKPILRKTVDQFVMDNFYK